MNIQIEWHESQFNVLLASQDGAEPFITIKGCRIASGSKGDFVSWPSTKNAATNKWWQHVWGSEKFNAVVLSKAQASMPKPQPRRAAAAAPPDDLSDVPF